MTVPYTINVKEYVCSTLSEIRKMNENRDYSGLGAAVERIQHHVNNMENGLCLQKDLIDSLHAKLKEDKVEKSVLLKEIEKVYPDLGKDEEES